MREGDCELSRGGRKYLKFKWHLKKELIYFLVCKYLSIDKKVKFLFDLKKDYFYFGSNEK